MITIARSRLGKLTSLLRDGGDLGSVLRGAGAAGTITAAGVALAYAVQVALARVMGATEFGIYTYAWSWAALLVIPALLGLNTAILRFVPEYRTRGDKARLRGVIGSSQAMVLGFSVVLATVGGLVVFVLRDSMAAYFEFPLYLALAAVPLLSLLSMQTSLSRAFGWVVLATVPTNIGAHVLLLGGVGVAVLAGLRIDGIAVLVVALMSYAVLVPAHRWRLTWRLSHEVPPAQPRYDTALWLNVAFPLFLLSGFQIVMDRSDLIMLGLMLSPDDVAVYQAAAKTSAIVIFALAMMNFIGAPKIAELYAQKRLDELQKLVTGIVGWVFWPSLLAALAALLFGRAILGLFGPEFDTGYIALAILAVGKLCNACTGPVGYIMALTGHQRESAKVLGVCAILNVALNLGLIPVFGIVGAAMATAIAMALWNLWLLVLVRRKLGIHSFIIPWPIRA